jgi:hypothetical protein
MEKAQAEATVNAWLKHRARALREAAERADTIGAVTNMGFMAHLYAERLREAALALERPIGVPR